MLFSKFFAITNINLSQQLEQINQDICMYVLKKKKDKIRCM
jgi:hypothetical protein